MSSSRTLEHAKISNRNPKESKMNLPKLDKGSPQKKDSMRIKERNMSGNFCTSTFSVMKLTSGIKRLLTSSTVQSMTRSTLVTLLQVKYILKTGLLINESNDEVWKSIVHSIEADIRSRNEAAQSLALSLIATIVPDMLVAALSDTIIDLAISSKSSTAVSKKAIMCLSRIIKKHPNNYDVKKFIGPLSEMFDRKSSSLSYQNAAASFLLQLMSISNPDTLIEIQPKVVKLVHRLALYKSGGGEVSANYVYF